MCPFKCMCVCLSGFRVSVHRFKDKAQICQLVSAGVRDGPNQWDLEVVCPHYPRRWTSLIKITSVLLCFSTLQSQFWRIWTEIWQEGATGQTYINLGWWTLYGIATPRQGPITRRRLNPHNFQYAELEFGMQVRLTYGVVMHYMICGWWIDPDTGRSPSPTKVDNNSFINRKRIFVRVVWLTYDIVIMPYRNWEWWALYGSATPKREPPTP